MLPQSRALTRTDLASMADDGHRYELIDGALVVTPAPSWRHQAAVVRLVVLLDEACPSDLRVLTAPFDVALADTTVVQPDVLVARRDGLSSNALEGPPQLAVEVLSPSTRLIDLNLKRARYEAAGRPSYWVVDIDQPSLTAWELSGGAYVEVAHVTGSDTYTAITPYAVTICPARLSD